jgi:hypothetical protein
MSYGGQPASLRVEHINQTCRFFQFMKKFLQKYSDIKNLYPLRYIIFGEIFAILLYNINIQRGTNANTFLENEMRNSNLNNNYHIVLASDENIKYLEDFCVICGYDVKHDFNAACFKINILTYCELYSKD